jgi:hypothetical protein
LDLVFYCKTFKDQVGFQETSKLGKWE